MIVWPLLRSQIVSTAPARDDITSPAKPGKREDMAIRLIVTIAAAPGRGAELAQLCRAYCTEVMKEPGCEQFEVFQSVVNPEKLVLLERWIDKAALDVHALTSTRPTLSPELRVGTSEREDYEYNRTR
jgi:quinol monooxygenase YgiN